MKTEIGSSKPLVVMTRCRVMLEPELQAEIGSMPPGPRRALAKKFHRWAHQLDVSAAILESNARTIPPPKRVRWLSSEKAKKN